MEASVRDLGALATIALLFFAVLHVMLLAHHRRRLEDRLGESRAEVERLRLRLAEATRPPAQFARMRLREEAAYRFARLRRAAPRRGRGSDLAQADSARISAMTASAQARTAAGSSHGP